MSLRPHTLNKNFVWSDRPQTGLRTLSCAQVSQYNSDGYCVLRGALDGGAIGGILSEVDAIEREIETYVLTLDDAQPVTYRADDMTFAIDLIARAPSVGALCHSALFAGIVHDLVGEDVRLYWNQAVYKKPEKGRVFPWHQDNGYTFTEPQTYLTCWIALTEATLENGCVWILPGVHRKGTLAHERTDSGLQIEGVEALDEEARAVEASPGDIVLFSSLTPHRTGANLTGATRKALILQFAPEGLARMLGDGTRAVQDDAARNPWILKAGKAV